MKKTIKELMEEITRQCVELQKECEAERVLMNAQWRVLTGSQNDLIPEAPIDETSTIEELTLSEMVGMPIKIKHD